MYNSELYIEKAILSVIDQNYVSEILVVDDGSTDTSVSICQKLMEQYDKIRLLWHSDKSNHGRSKTKNLGIQKATSDYIAFLDADDYYLPNRFDQDMDILLNDASVDGVYNAIGSHFYREASGVEKDKLELTTTSVRIDPNELFENMGPIGHQGYFSGIGFTVRKESLLKTGLFREDLEVAEDTDLWIKMSLLLKLQPGIIDRPVAMRGVHHDNVSFVNRRVYRKNNLKMYKGLLSWMFKRNIPFNRCGLVWKKVWIQHQINKTNFFRRMLFWMVYLMKYPSLLRSIDTYKFFPVIRMFKKDRTINLE